MPALTRAAAKRLEDTEQSVGGRDVSTLALRTSVSAKADEVWASRGGVDVYTGKLREETSQCQCDHVLEVQLAEGALVRAFVAERARAGSMATAHAGGLLRDAVNGLCNLNVTSAAVNQAKRGPFTAALNRLHSDTLRSVPIENFVRSGRGAWMMDTGVWARVSDAVVKTYDTLDDELRGGGVDAPRESAALVEGSLDELRSMLTTLGFQ